MINLLLVAIGGAIGALFRYILSGFVTRLSGDHWFPFGTLTVNLIGCLLIGYLIGVLETKDVISPDVRIFFMVGVLGSFTTYSAFGIESVMLLREGYFMAASANILSHVILGLAGVWAGLELAELH